MGVGMPHQLLLQEYGEHIRRAFGHVPFWVGSSLTQKSGWRDVDVRLILSDEEYERMGLGDPNRQQWNPRWCSIVMAWSVFGKTLTGLPIDFQIQQASYARDNEKGMSSALIRLCDLKYPTPKSDDSTDSTPHHNPKSDSLVECPTDSDSRTGK